MTDLIWHGSNRSERRLQALEDAEAIRDLKARYAALWTTWRASLIEPGQPGKVVGEVGQTGGITPGQGPIIPVIRTLD